MAARASKATEKLGMPAAHLSCLYGRIMTAVNYNDPETRMVWL